MLNELITAEASTGGIEAAPATAAHAPQEPGSLNQHQQQLHQVAETNQDKRNKSESTPLVTVNNSKQVATSNKQDHNRSWSQSPVLTRNKNKINKSTITMMGKRKIKKNRVGYMRAPMVAGHDVEERETTEGSPCRTAIRCKQLSFQVTEINIDSLCNPQKLEILHDIEITVPEGSIYGLLGPSGCGKTTLLKCIAGRFEPSSGSIHVFGFEPGKEGSQIPGPGIGFMPQELSVYEEFTTEEILIYFGMLNRIPMKLIKERIEFLVAFLDLPHKDRLIYTLSGGQKRRVSLAAALIHSPPLLVLDEPTVGVDPLLREIIWNYLVQLAETDKITIIITTHYIEEARQANLVGLMRYGKLLAEDTPRNLMLKYHATSLEDVFLHLCMADQKKAKNDGINGLAVNGSPKILSRLSASSPVPSTSRTPSIDENRRLSSPSPSPSAISADQVTLMIDEEVASISKKLDQTTPLKESEKSSEIEEFKRILDEKEKKDKALDAKSIKKFTSRMSSTRTISRYLPYKTTPLIWLEILWAVIWKCYIRLKRNPPVILFEFLLPAFQVVLFCLCVGGDPFDVPIAIVNDESNPISSKMFLNSLDSEKLRQISFDKLESALKSVERGDTWGVLYIPENYTNNLKERLSNPMEASNETLKNGTISIYPDLTNLHLALSMERTITKTFIKFARNSLELLGYNPDVADLPVKIERSVYGGVHTAPNYLEFMAPGVFISITYVIATGLTALSFILEKRDGLLERSRISGVTSTQLLLAHFSLQIIVLTFQIALVLLVTFLCFDLPSQGPLYLVIAMIMLQGCTGMSFGLLISAICNEESTAVMMLVGTFYINLILAGIIWPIEAMPKWLRPLSYAQPQTLPIQALRSILSRGWGLDEPTVYLGFLITIAWLVLFLFLAGFFMRYLK